MDINVLLPFSKELDKNDYDNTFSFIHYLMLSLLKVGNN